MNVGSYVFFQLIAFVAQAFRRADNYKYFSVPFFGAFLEGALLTNLVPDSKVSLEEA